MSTPASPADGATHGPVSRRSAAGQLKTPTADAPWVLPLAAPGATLALAGGKGANLARLAQAGLRVPPGFLVTTQGYRAFVAANNLTGAIQAALPPGLPDRPEALDAASAQIRSLFALGRIPADLAEAVRAAYIALGGPAVAVRSSATAEDLPEMSFAGQQDTFLNVMGGDALLAAIVDCWSSLWTPRAIGYRLRNRVAGDDIALAVVVQSMVQSQAAGVLFTANPLTGLRRETVIDATVGLGEALVSGQVEPDHYVVDTRTGQITTCVLGSKAISIRSRPGGGTVQQAEAGQSAQALPDEQIRELAGLGQQVAALYGGTPQDIEWAWAGDALYLLQARPITSLYPLPAGMPAEPLQALFSMAAVQGMLDPMTPLGRDVLAEIGVIASRLFDIHTTREKLTPLRTAGDRLWVNITPLLRNQVGRAGITFALSLVEPTINQAVRTVWDEPDFQPGRRRFSARGLWRIAHFALPLAGNLLLNLAAPDARRKGLVAWGERVLDEIRTANVAAASGTGAPRARLARLAKGMPAAMETRLPHLMLAFVAGVASGMASLNLLRVLTRAPDAGGEPADTWDRTLLEVTRGLPHNPTTEMDLTLWQISQEIRRDPASYAAFTGQTAGELTRAYQAGSLPHTARAALGRFLAYYGGRGLAEFDTGRPRWSEDPTHVIDVLRGYLQIEDVDRAPNRVFAAGVAGANATIQQMIARARRGPRGWLRARQVRFAAGRTRALLGIREMPKFFAVRMMWAFRQPLLQLGEQLVCTGELAQPDDLFYLSLTELSQFAAGNSAAGSSRDWAALIGERRAAYNRELLRRQLPRLLLSDGRAFYDGLNGGAAAAGTLVGSPVSPGAAQGRVRVVRDPRSAGLLPGEILVCPGTDPSWTPLFLTAGGLVMEVGGMMTHGAVVAREYGIPAVVGVHEATTRLQTGQLIRVDGSNGVITLLADGD